MTPQTPPQLGPPNAVNALLGAFADLLVLVDGDGRVVFASEAANRLLRRPARFLVGQKFAGLVHPDDRHALSELLLSARPLGDDPPGPTELRLSHLHGLWVPTEATATAVPPGEGAQGVVLHLRDIRARKAHDAALRHGALHDPLTGLANRTLFAEVLGQALARHRDIPLRPHALLFLDLDGFKRINDSLGHALGDEVLTIIGDRMRTRIRPGDTAARLGGDEFGVLLENSSERDAEAMARRLLDVIRQPCTIRGKELFVSASIGIALTEPGGTAEDLLRDADVAMYEAKTAGKGRYQVFRPEMQQAARRRLDLEADVRRAIAEGELAVHFQPIVVLGTGEITGAEALVRWRHATRGWVPPGEFIPVAEDSGLIRPIGAWVLRQACRELKRWTSRFPQLATGFRMSVNVSVRQIEDEQFFEEVAGCLAEFALDPSTLTLEITESLIMRDFADAVARLQRLKSLGLKIAIDDFGTGYSSLRYLKVLPIDVLKIDKSFVDGVADGPEAAAVALAVIKLARTFGLSTLAEGIERGVQASALVEMGAELGQGFYFARPMGRDLMERFLEERLGPDGTLRERTTNVA